MTLIRGLKVDLVYNKSILSLYLLIIPENHCFWYTILLNDIDNQLKTAYTVSNLLVGGIYMFRYLFYSKKVQQLADRKFQNLYRLIK